MKIVVIGGTGELCGAMAEGLAGAGAEVVLAGRSLEKAEARLKKIAAAGGKAWFHAAEATSKAEVEGLRDAVLKRSGRIDIVVNGAGINSATPFFDITEEEWDRVLAVTLKSQFLMGKHVAQQMAAQGTGGRIVNIGHQKGSKVTIDLIRVMLKRLTLTGSTLRIRSSDVKARIAAAVAANVLPHFADGSVTAVLDRTFPLADAAAAHARMESSEHVGKIVLVVGS